MKCANCGRGLTWRRVARDAAFLIYREGMEERPVCGQCIERGSQPVPEGAALFIFVPAGPLDYRLMVDEHETHFRQCFPHPRG